MGGGRGLVGGALAQAGCGPGLALMEQLACFNECAADFCFRTRRGAREGGWPMEREGEIGRQGRGRSKRVDGAHGDEKGGGSERARG